MPSKRLPLICNRAWSKGSGWRRSTRSNSASTRFGRSRHILKDDWLRTLYFELKKTPSAIALRGDAEEWMGQWGIEWEAKVPKFLELEEKALRQLREDFARIHKAGAALLHRVRPSFCH